jgi:TatD DNase family protein
MKYVDIHCHLDFLDYDSDREEVLKRMKNDGVGAITIGAGLESSKMAVEIAEQNENTRLPSPEGSANGGQVWACIGIHPEEAAENDSLRSYDAAHISLREYSQPLEELIKSPKVVGIGECGLDYFRLKDENQKVFQKKLFEEQIKFAVKHDKPLMLHIRNAYDDALNILENYKKEAGEKLWGNVHFFAGDISIAKKFLDLGFTMSFTGVITFTHDYDEVIKYLPENSIMSETDAPFVAPVPHRGKRNEPVYVIEVVRKLAEIKGKDPDTLNNSILENFRRVFGVQSA